MAMQTGTFQYLADRGYARGEARANTDALASACIEKMLGRLVETTNAEEIQERGLLASELRELVLGTPDDEEIEADLDDLITRITTAEGKLQNKLENGFVLCSARVQRTIANGNGDEPTVVSRTARFLTDKPDVIEAFYIAPQHDITVKKAKGLKGRWERVVGRHPEMAQRRQAYLSRTQQRLELELEVQA
jgi:hypothetical protein